MYGQNRPLRVARVNYFQNSKDEIAMSVFAENIAQAHGEIPSDILKGRWSGWYLAAVPTEWMRQHNQKVYLDPDNQDSDDYHPSHAAVDGPKDAKMRPKLAAKYEWVVPPP